MTTTINPAAVVLGRRQREVLRAVVAERLRQEEVHERSITDLPDLECLAILTEEVGEVATAAIEYVTRTPEAECLASLREELIQVAAVAVAWAERLISVPFDSSAYMVMTGGGVPDPADPKALLAEKDLRLGDRLRTLTDKVVTVAWAETHPELGTYVKLRWPDGDTSTTTLDYAASLERAEEHDRV